jgi:hypothetical protein
VQNYFYKDIYSSDLAVPRFKNKTIIIIAKQRAAIAIKK